MTIAHDIIVLGSGFGGSLLSTLLAKSGLQVVMIDRQRHPRFAIGESSTPLADATLRALAAEFDLPELESLSRYGSWKQTHPQLTCGLKRGFSYFGHTQGSTFRTDDQLLVAASSDDQHADTHWLRSDVDAWLFQVAQSWKVCTFENAVSEVTQQQTGWRVTGTSDQGSIDVCAPLIVDATGGRSAVLDCLKIADWTVRLKTQSAAVFAHFSGVTPVAQLLDARRIRREAHPFSCDAAAVHHILHSGWMWQLRFDDDSVSAGIVTDLRRDGGRMLIESPAGSWSRQLADYSFLREQFQNATVIRPAGEICGSGRLQRLSAAAAGASWAALPHTVGFIDPLHSTGIAHTLFAVSRLAAILTASDKTEAARQRALLRYSEAVIDELCLVDELVEGCYAALPNFGLWCDWCMLYFAAVTSMEQQNVDIPERSFLCASDARFRTVIRQARQQLELAQRRSDRRLARLGFQAWLREAIRPWNVVGLLDPAARGMYRHSAAPTAD